jgi:hypothetical protein
MQNGQNRCLIMRSARVHHYKRISTPLSEQIVVSAEEIWIEIQKNVFPREQQPSCIGEIRNDQVSSFNILPAPKWKKVLRPLYLKFRQGKHNHLVNLDMISPRADLLRQTEKTALVYRPVWMQKRRSQLFCCQSTYSVLTGESEHRNFSFVRDQHMHEKNNSPSPKTNRINLVNRWGKNFARNRKPARVSSRISSTKPVLLNPSDSLWRTRDSQIFFRERSPNINLRKQMISTENPRREMPQKIEPEQKK